MLVQLGTARSSRRSTLRFADRRRSFFAFREKNEKIPMRQAPFLGPVPPWVNAVSVPEPAAPARDGGTRDKVPRFQMGWSGFSAPEQSRFPRGRADRHEWESERSYPDRGTRCLLIGWREREPETEWRKDMV